jgi:diguanylate cyclase (GGDEF)-like protein
MEIVLEKKECDYYKDQLTGLDNRFALMKYLESDLDLNVLAINLDNFSSINNAYGYIVGDEILVQVGKLLNIIKPKDSKLFRFEGDEFVFVFDKEVSSDRVLEEFAELIISFFNQTEIEAGHDDIVVKVSPSVGMATGKGSVTLNYAKMAITEARLHSGNAYKIFSEKSKYVKKQQKEVYWINKIRHAISDEKLFSFFQPIRNNQTKQIEKFECLARIEDDGVMISPIKFMDAAKITGTLNLITKAIIIDAFRVFSKNDYEFSINITGNDLHLGYLEDYLLMNAKKYNIEPSRVVLELLEDIVSLTEADMLEQINSIRRHGFQIAIDDFGQENSNFARLLDLSPDYLKIDGAFIKNIVDDRRSQIIVEAIVGICKKSDIKVIAEFTHNKDVLEKVEMMGIEYAQGYYIGEPKRAI